MYVSVASGVRPDFVLTKEVLQSLSVADLAPLTRLQNLEYLSIGSGWSGLSDRAFIECCLVGRNNPKHCWPKLTCLHSLALRPPAYNGPAQKKGPPKVPPGYLAKVFPSLKSTSVRGNYEPSEFELHVLHLTTLESLHFGQVMRFELIRLAGRGFC
jgi:hypothetical protein